MNSKQRRISKRHFPYSVNIPEDTSEERYLEIRDWCKLHFDTIEPIINCIEIHKWCVELFGTEDSIWDNYNGRWYINDRRIWFRDESDLLVFILKWT